MMEAVVTSAGPLAAALAVVFLALGLRHVVRSRRGEGLGDTRPELGHKPSRDHCHDVALWCLRRGHLAEAQDLFLRAGEPGRAAQVATRLGDHRLAGTLYETAGELLRAAAAYEHAGMAARASELRAAGQLAEAPTSRYLALDLDRPQRILRAGHGAVPEETPCPASAEGRGATRGVRQAWAAFRAALPLGASSAPSPGLPQRPGTPGGPSAGVVWDFPTGATGEPSGAAGVAEVRLPATAAAPATTPPARPTRHRFLSPFGVLRAVARGGTASPRRDFEDSWEILISGEPPQRATSPAPRPTRPPEPLPPPHAPRRQGARLTPAPAEIALHEAHPPGPTSWGPTTRDYAPSSIPPPG
ncbi:MAG: hypothetical protein Q8S73_17590 [Deltaproteobacteria bacterium]|nr:hypothetical protein [Rhodocyclaceae bacterium]MDP3215924.1 hypothetical protein [Deltaproteobacteria bacterium]